LQKLRDAYAAAMEESEKAPSPKDNDPQFKEKLDAWYVRYQAVEVTRRALIRELVRRFAAENTAEADVQATAEELKKRVAFAHGVLNAGKDT
jgi:hypothetical protein